MSTTHPEANLLEALEGESARLLERHLDSERTWSPHEQIDWGTGDSFQRSPWSPEDYPLPDGVRSAIYVNLLTEDNLPYYTSVLTEWTPSGHPLQEWNHQWTMEEDRHSTVIRDWVHVSRCIDPDLLEQGRRVQMRSGTVPVPDAFVDMICYVAFQEKATQIAHRNTASRLPKDDVMGRNVLATVAGDETKHFVFYRDLALAGFAAEPSLMMCATSRQLERFAMPGTGIPGFTRHAVRISREGIYGLRNFLDDVVVPVTSAWDLEGMSGLDAEAEMARDRIFAFIESVRASIRHSEERAERRG